MKPVEKYTLVKPNYLKFRCHLDSCIGKDAHREFSGVYYPRFRAMYLDEVRTIVGVRGLPTVKLFPQFPFDVYLTPTDEYFFTNDFYPGAKISFGQTRSARDKAAKTFVVVEVDTTKLDTPTQGIRVELEKRKLPKNVIENLMKIREGFIHAAEGSIEKGVKAAGRHFRHIDDSGDRKVDAHEFQKALAEVHVDFSIGEIEEMFNAFDPKSHGVLSFESLLNVLRGEMSEARKEAVAAAFRKVDYTQKGKVTLHDLEVKYCADRQPEVLGGLLTPEQVLHGFLSGWDTHHKNGIISYAEFQDYYHGVSATVQDDRDFLSIVGTAWNL